MTNFNQSFFIQKSFIRLIQIIFCICQLSFNTSNANETNPLTPINTSSPRATLQGFLETSNKAYASGLGFVKSLHSSNQLYFSRSDIIFIQNVNRPLMESVQRTLNLSQVPPDMLYSSSRQSIVQLKEILDRINLPPFETIPDESIMNKSEYKFWTIPGTEIKIALVENGPQKGEYLFTSDTINRLPEFYLKVKNMPYKPRGSIGWYDFYSSAPMGLAYLFPRLIPISWLLNPPSITQIMFLDQPLWRWLCIIILFAIGFFIILLCHQLKRYLAKRLSSKNQSWVNLLLPLCLTVISSTIVLLIDRVLRTSGIVYQVLSLSLWTLFYLTLTWAIWSTGSATAESVISYEKLRASSIDSQLIRLIIRIITLILSITIIIIGADHIGLPAYSVMAGLGVGGLAVALAAQQTLANLLGSIIIMIEKPFSLGHWIKLKDVEGKVENVGFRSTSIRTFHDSLVTIPNSQMISSTIDNMALRKYRQIETILNLNPGTPTHKIESFIEGTKILLRGNPNTRKDKILVALDSLGSRSCPVIMISYYLNFDKRMDEIKERERILLDIMYLADSININFMT